MHTPKTFIRFALAAVMAAAMTAPPAAQSFRRGQDQVPAVAPAPSPTGTSGSGDAATPASVPGAPTPASTRAAQRKKDYQLVAGDKLRIEVYKDPQLSQSLQVRPDGKITLPLLGDVDAAGLTPLALRDVLANSLKEYITNPVVTVIVVEAQPATVYVVGEVNSPGAIQINGSMTVLQTLALAGGLKDFADTKNIRVLRNGIAGVQTIPFNYRDALQGVGAPVYVNPGDTVVVPN